MDAQAEALLEVRPGVRDVAADVALHLPVIREGSAQELVAHNWLHPNSQLIAQQANMACIDIRAPFTSIYEESVDPWANRKQRALYAKSLQICHAG